MSYTQPKRDCPYCGTKDCEADWVDVGIGYAQCGPYHCENCYASQIGPYDDPRELTDEEKDTGWYKPGSPPGSSANTIDGEIVDHETARRAYRASHGVFD